MRFSVDGWDPTYGMSLELEDYLDESTASVEVNIEMPADQWRPIDPDPARNPPAALLFVDGVRRIEARVWIDDDAPGNRQATEASAALCASYAAGRGLLLQPPSPRCQGRDPARALYRGTARQPTSLRGPGSTRHTVRRRTPPPRCR